MTLIDVIHKRDTELQKILDSIEHKKVFNIIRLWLKMWWQDTQRQLLWNSPWKDAQGDDLPEIGREVVAFQEDFPNLFRIVVAHRPNPEGYDGKSIATGVVEHYTPKTYDKGGWNIPDVKWWLDVKLPKEIEL